MMPQSDRRIFLNYLRCFEANPDNFHLILASYYTNYNNLFERVKEVQDDVTMLGPSVTSVIILE